MTLGLVMIVKNESERIEACLDAVKPYVDSYCIVDTGSTDDTVAICKRKMFALFEVQNIGFVHERPWVNFGYNRSEALTLALDMHCDWLLCLDADMIAEFNETAFHSEGTIAATLYGNVEAYLLETAPDPTSWSNRLPSLIRGDIAWKYAGAVHEYLAKADDSSIIAAKSDAIILHTTNRSTPEKNQWYASLLEAELADTSKPLNQRSLFYLAKTYSELGDTRALRTYQRRSELDYGSEYTYLSLLYQGRLEPHWQTANTCYIRAWDMRPFRMEAPYELAVNYRKHEMWFSAYHWASLPYGPVSDVVFIEQAVYTWGMTFERSIAASRLGRHDEALAICDTLLSRDTTPEHIKEAVRTNRKFSLKE